MAEIDRLAAQLLPLFPQLDTSGRTIALTLYRQLAQGAPVSLAALAERLEMPSDRVTARLRDWPGDLSHNKIHAADCATCETKEGRIDKIERRITLEGLLDDAQRAKLLEIADKC